MITQFKSGVSSIKKGFQFLLAEKRLLLLALIPWTINIFFLAGGVWVFLHYFDTLYSHTIDWFGLTINTDPVGWWATLLHWGKLALHYTIKGVIGIFGFLNLFLITFFVAQIVAGPFNDLISEYVEEKKRGVSSPTFSLSYFIKSIHRTVIVEIQKTLFFVSIPILLLLLNLIPGIGSLFYLILVNIFACWAFGFAFIDYPISRKLWGFKERLLFARTHKFNVMGLGVFYFVPFFGLIFSAPLVVAGTLEFLVCERKLAHDLP